MTTIKYLDQVIHVPTNWDEIKLKDYENFYLDRPENTRDRVALVAKICNVEPSVFLEAPAEIFNIVVDKSFFIFEEFKAEPSPKITIDGSIYVIPIEEKLSLGAYIDADETQKAGDQIISGILAIVCRPVNEPYDDDLTEARAAMFANVPMSQIWPLLAFFLQCKSVLEARTMAFTNLAQAVESLPPSTLISVNRGGGIKLLQIWPKLKYYVLTRLLRYRLQRLLHSSNTKGIKIRQTSHKGN